MRNEELGIRNKELRRGLPRSFTILFVLLLMPVMAHAQAQGQGQGQASPFNPAQGTTAMPTPPPPPIIPFIDLTVRNPESGNEVAFSLQLLLLLTVLSLAPSIIILMTSFLRISIVLDFIKRALSLQQVPPNQVIMGVSLFLTVLIMWPTFSAVYESSLRPLSDGQINVETAYRNAETPLKIFMFNQMRSLRGGLSSGERNIEMFMAMRGLPSPIPFMIFLPMC